MSKFLLCALRLTAASSLLAACTTPSLDEKPFACATDNQCGAGWFCGPQGICLIDGTPIQSVCTFFYDDPATEFFDRLQAGDPCTSPLPGACAIGKVTCTETAAVCRQDREPGTVAETCNGTDDDCNGVTDDGFAVGESCDGNGDGCFAGRFACDPNDTTQTTCEENGELPIEVCDNLDNDCDGSTDEEVGPNGASLGSPCTGRGTCGAGTLECAPDQTTRCSSDRGGSTDQSTDELCNGLDDDCDGTNDEDFTYLDEPIGGTCTSTGVCGPGTVECLNTTTTTCSTNPDGSDPQALAGQCGGATLIFEQSGPSAIEDGATVTVSVRLSSPPTATVQVLASVEPNTEASVTPASHPFNSANWNTPKQFTISAIDDPRDDGDHPFELRLYVQTTDPDFAAVVPAPLLLTAVDDDIAAIKTTTIDKTSTEAGGTAEVQVSLATEPTGLVRLTTSYHDTADVIVQVATLEFDANTWATPKPIVITGKDDLDADGDTPYKLRLTIDRTRTVDPNYLALPPTNVDLTSVDGVCGNDLMDGTEACDNDDQEPCRALGIIVENDLSNCSADCQTFDSSRCGYAFVDIATSASQACAIRARGEVVCWDRDQADFPTDRTYQRIAFGDRGDSNQGIACALATDGSIECDGSGPSGTDFVDLDAGKGTSYLAGCAVRSGGSIVCFGSSPPASPAGTNFTRVAVGQNFACGLTTSGTITCWGTANPLPTAPSGSDFVQIAASRDKVCGRRSTGTLECSGNEPTTTDWVDLAANSSSIVGLRANGTAWTVSSNPTALLSGQGTFEKVSGRCAITATGGVACLPPNTSGGSNLTLAPSGFGWRDLLPHSSSRGAGIRGDGRFIGWSEYSSPPVLGPTVSDFVSLTGAPNNDPICALRATGEVLCTGITNPPTDLLASDIAVYSSSYACALTKPSGNLRCWGSQAAIYPPPNGTHTALTTIQGRGFAAIAPNGSIATWNGPSGLPTVPTGTGFAEVVGNTRGTCARVTSDGSVVCVSGPGWGTPALPTPNTGFTQIDSVKDSSSYESFCGVRTDGTIQCWGGSSPSPPSGNDFARVFLGGYSSSDHHALRADGTVVTFGQRRFTLQP